MILGTKRREGDLRLVSQLWMEASWTPSFSAPLAEGAPGPGAAFADDRPGCSVPWDSALEVAFGL